MNLLPAVGVSDQTEFFRDNPHKAVALLNVLNRLLEWEATLGGWESKAWDDAHALVEEFES